MKVSADAVIIYKGKYLFIKRSPTTRAYPNMPALCGGFIEDDETIKDGMIREIKEETGLDVLSIMYVAFFDDLGRDPRWRTITFLYLVLADPSSVPIAGDDASEIILCDLNNLPPKLAFDHDTLFDRVMDVIDN